MLVLFLSWDLKYTGLVTNFGPVPFIPWGTSRRFGRSKTHNEKAPTAQDISGVGVKADTDSTILNKLVCYSFIALYLSGITVSRVGCPGTAYWA